MKRLAKSIDITESDGESYDSDEEDAVRAVEGKKEDTPTDDAKKEAETAVPIELQKKKKVRTGRPFTEADLVGPYGIANIYKTFPRAYQSRVPGNEARDLNRLVGMYKEWAFRLYPGLAFPDLIAKADQLGSKGTVRVEMERLRDEERNRYLELQGVNVRELLERKRAEDERRLAEEQARKQKRAKDDDSFIASDSDSDSDSGLFKPDKQGKNKLKKSKSVKRASRDVSGGVPASGSDANTQEQLGDDEEEDDADTSSSDESSLVIEGDDDDEKDNDDNEDKVASKLAKSKSKSDRKRPASTLTAVRAEEDEEEETGAQENYDFLDSLDFVE